MDAAKFADAPKRISSVTFGELSQLCFCHYGSIVGVAVKNINHDEVDVSRMRAKAPREHNCTFEMEDLLPDQLYDPAGHDEARLANTDVSSSDHGRRVLQPKANMYVRSRVGNPKKYCWERIRLRSDI